MKGENGSQKFFSEYVPTQEPAKDQIQFKHI